MCVHVFISSTLIQRASAAAPNLSYECKWKWKRLSLGFSSPSAHSMPSTASGYSRSLTLYMCVCVWAKLFEHDLGLCVCVSRHTGSFGLTACPPQAFHWKIHLNVPQLLSYSQPWLILIWPTMQTLKSEPICNLFCGNKFAESSVM